MTVFDSEATTTVNLWCAAEQEKQLTAALPASVNFDSKF